MVERIKFPGDPVPRETGVPGSTPNIPLTGGVSPTTVEMLDQENQTEDGGEIDPKNFRRPPRDGDDYNDEADDALEEVDYSRESIGARIGQNLEETQATAALERQLDVDDVVPCILRKAVNLQDKGLMHHWGPGVHLIPVSLAGDKKSGAKMHFWLRHNGVKRTGARQTNPNKVFRDDDDE